MRKDYNLEKRKLVIGGFIVAIVIIYIIRLVQLQFLTHLIHLFIKASFARAILIF